MICDSLNKKTLRRIAEIIIILSILVSGFVLFAYERRQNNPDYNKSWVAFYFVDPNFPEKGVMLENHLGLAVNFRFCLVPDSNDLIEPKDLSCSSSNVTKSVTKNIAVGGFEKWLYSVPPASPAGRDKQGKYWVVAEYMDKDNILKSKDLSFEVK
ncbi:MAG: hypothetical protein V1690_01460 [Candidatus Moraniibacteriota bacterium]